MIVRISCKEKKPGKLAEFAVPAAEIWNGEYSKVFREYYKAHKENYHVSEYRDGLIVKIPAEDAPLIKCRTLTLSEYRSKIKISEVFELCEKDLKDIGNPNS